MSPPTPPLKLSLTQNLTQHQNLSQEHRKVCSFCSFVSYRPFVHRNHQGWRILLYDTFIIQHVGKVKVGLTSLAWYLSRRVYVHTTRRRDCQSLRSHPTFQTWKYSIFMSMMHVLEVSDGSESILYPNSEYCSFSITELFRGQSLWPLTRSVHFPENKPVSSTPLLRLGLSSSVWWICPVSKGKTGRE